MKAFSAVSVLAAALSGSAVAGPLLSVNATVVSGGQSWIKSDSSTGEASGSLGTYQYVGGLVSNFPTTKWGIGWDLLGDDTAVKPNATFLTNGLTVTNYTNSSMTFDITVTLAASTASPVLLNCLGSMGGTLAVNSGASGSTASLTRTGSLDMWQGLINGTSKLPLNLAVTPVTTTTSVALTGVNGTWNASSAVTLSSIGYRMQFTLGANSTANFTGVWSGTVVPTPGAVAMLFAATGAGAFRRRRSSH